MDAVTDIRGNVWKYKYDANGQLISRADPAGDTTTVSYAQSIPAPKSSLALGTEGLRIDPSTGSTLKLKDVWSAARVGNFVDCLGTITGSVEWIRKIRLFKVVITDNKGNSKTFYYPPGVGVDVEMGSESFDSYGNLLAKSIWDGKYQQRYTNERGEITVTNYNFNYQPVSIIYADGSIEKNEYEEVKGLQVKNINALGVVTEWKYDSKGSVIEQIEAFGTPVQRKTVWEYDQWGQPTKRTLGEGADAIVWQYRYDAYGNVAEMTDSVGDIWKYSYTAAGDVATETDPLGRITKYEYDAGGNQIKVTSPKGYEIRTAYNSINLPSELTDALGRKSQIAYNNQGQITSVTNAKGESAKYTFNAYGNPTTETTPAGNTTQFEHDKKGRVTALVDPAGNRITFEHGDNGTPQADVMTAMVLPGGTRQEFKYDQRGRTTLVTLKATGLDPVSESTTYDALGQIVASTNAAGHTSVAEYDALGRTTKITDAAGNSTLVTYNLLDQATSVTDALGNVHRFSYDKAGQLLEKTRPEGGKTRYQYDKAGQLTHVTDADGNQTAYTYDEDGNVTQQSRTSAASSALSQTVSYAYDVNGDLTGYTQKGSLGEVISKASYTLDVLGRVSEETVTYGEGAGAITRTFTREWDADWNTTSIGYDNRKTVAEYASGQLKNIKTPDGKQIQITKYNWMYPQTIQYPGSTRTQNYDGFFRPSEIHVKSSKSQTLLKLGYQYTKNSNIASQSVEQQGLIGKIDYQYDTLDRLTQAAPSQALVDFGLPNEGYGYDAVGNRTSSNHQAGPWQYATGNRLMQKGDTSYTYTASGHIQTATSGGITRNYVYDGAQRLIQVTEAGKNIASYQYDPAGRRISKVVGDGVFGKSWYIYDAEGLVEELDQSGKTSKSYGRFPDSYFGGGIVWQSERIADIDSYFYLNNDHLDRPIVGNDASGNFAWAALSESFGLSHINPGSSIDVKIQYPGQYWDDETETAYNTQRDYNPASGRYIQSDPLGLYDGVNTYLYAHGNALSNIDPTGEFVPVALYLKCVAECKVADAALAALQSECDPRTLGDCLKECINPLEWLKIPGFKFLNKVKKPRIVKVTSFVSKRDGVQPDLNLGRWVVQGDATLSGFLKSGLWGGRIDGFKFSGQFKMSNYNSVTGYVPSDMVRWPSGWNAWRGIFGQRQIRSPK